jgi:hypothetical protein
MWLSVCGMHRDLASLKRLTSKIFPFKTAFLLSWLDFRVSKLHQHSAAACALLLVHSILRLSKFSPKPNENPPKIPPA